MTTKKKSNSVVYTPINAEVPTVQEAVNQISLKTIPPYDDKGVSYKGFSKTYLGNDYKLNIQEPFYKCYRRTGTGFLEVIPFGVKELYLTQISIQYVIGAANVGNSFYYDDSTTGIGSSIDLVNLPHTGASILIPLNPPLKLVSPDGSGVRFAIADVMNTGSWAVQLTGFYENK